MQQHQIVSDRSFNVQAFFIHYALMQTHFLNHEEVAKRTRLETVAVFWVMTRRPANMKGAVVERAFTHAQITEIGIVGRLLQCSRALCVYALHVCHASVGGLILEFKPPFEKLLIAPSREFATSSIEPRSGLSFIPDNVVKGLKAFGKEYTSRYTPDERAHTNYDVTIDLSYHAAVRTMTPQEVLVNYLETRDPPPDSTINTSIVDALNDTDEHLVPIGRRTYDEPDFDLDDELLLLDNNQPFGNMRPENLVAAYVSTHYHPATTLPFGRAGKHARLGLSDNGNTLDTKPDEEYEGDEMEGEAEVSVNVQSIQLDK